MKRMKRYMWAVLVVALVAAALFTAHRRFAAASGEDQNGRDVSSAAVPADVTLTNATHGMVVGTAAINADGTIASCWNCVSATTLQISTGQYQVGFKENVTANMGFSRWVQVDTLQTGAIDNVSCTTADRAGVSTAIYVACFNNRNGFLTDTSFFVFLAR